MIILYLDIETTYEWRDYNDMPQHGKDSFKRKFQNDAAVKKMMEGGITGITLDAALEKHYYEVAALYAEFSRVVCIGIGAVMLNKEDNTPYIFARCLSGSELEIFSQFNTILEKIKPDMLCAHNGKRFDFGFLSRRMMIHGFQIPEIMRSTGIKPWDLRLIDTVELWKFTDNSYYVSLVTLAFVFGVESPKQDIEGHQVPLAFFRGEIERIKTYCIGDVICLIHVHRAMTYEPRIEVIKIV